MKFKLMQFQMMDRCGIFTFVTSLLPKNEPEGFHPMHAHFLHFFGNLNKIGHQCEMDNFCNSKNFTWEVYHIKKMVLVHGVIRMVVVYLHVSLRRN